MIIVVSLFASWVLTWFLQWLYITFLSNYPIFQRRSQIEANKKLCIQQLHQNKKNIPTMGGIAMAVTFLIMMIVGLCTLPYVTSAPLVIVLFAVLGLVDDFIKIKQLRDGITPLEKMCGILLISLAASFINGELKQIFPGVVLLFFYALGCNSMNLTDGIDGLAAGISGIVFAALTYIAYEQNNDEMVWLSGVMCAICIGTLCWNYAPAKVFMGDTGALFLGGAVVYIASRLKILPWLGLLLIVCIWEVISVILQLTSIRFRKQKVFLIAPYHHHLEKLGWPELKIDYVMWGITLLCSVFTVVMVTN